MVMGWIWTGMVLLALGAPVCPVSTAAPFDILPAVWLTSVCSVTAGLLAAFLFGRASRA